MAYIIRSDIVVPDPQGKFAYLTRHGEAPRELAQYMAQLESAGFMMPASDFQGFKAFIEELTVAGIWGSVKEVYPLYGNSMESVTVKLKSELSSAKLSPVNGLSLSGFEVVDGRVKGTANRSFVNSNSPALDCGFDVGALNNSFITSFYMDSSSLNLSSGGTCCVFGAYLKLDTATQVATELRNSPSGVLQYGVSNQSSTVFSDAATPTETVGVVSFIGRPASRAIWVNGNRIYGGTNSIDATANTARRAWLLAKNPAGSNGSTTQGFNGRMRLACILDGDMPEDKIPLLNTSITNLMAALGRSF